MKYVATLLILSTVFLGFLTITSDYEKLKRTSSVGSAHKVSYVQRN